MFCREFGEDNVDIMLAAVEKHFPTIHVATRMYDGRFINRYVEGAALYYSLYSGNADPDIEILSPTDEENQEAVTLLNECFATVFDETDRAAFENSSRWILAKAMQLK